MHPSGALQPEHEKNPRERGFIRPQSDAAYFLDLGGFALPFAQIVELRAADFTVPDHLHVVNARRMDGERAFYADAIGNAANREGFPDAAVTLGDHGAFESLQTFTGTFHNLDPHADCVAHVDLWKIAAQLLRLDGADNFVHDVCLLPSQTFIRRSTCPNGQTIIPGQRTARILG